MTTTISPETLDALCAKLSIATPMGRNMLEECLLLATLLDAKQQDYGSANIADYGELGTVVRMNDKFRRLQNLMKPTKGRRKKVKNEAVMDTYSDIAGYAIITRLLRKGQWS